MNLCPHHGIDSRKFEITDQMHRMLREFYLNHGSYSFRLWKLLLSMKYQSITNWDQIVQAAMSQGFLVPNGSISKEGRTVVFYKYTRLSMLNIEMRCRMYYHSEMIQVLRKLDEGKHSD